MSDDNLSNNFNNTMSCNFQHITKFAVHSDLKKEAVILADQLFYLTA